MSETIRRRNPVRRTLTLILSLLMFAAAFGEKGTAIADSGDTSAPEVTIDTPSPGLAVSARSITISGTVADDPSLSEVRALIDGVEYGSMGREGPHIFDLDISALPEGAHTAQLSAFDSAGNRGDSEIRNFTVDRTIPTLSKTGGPERGAMVRTRRVRFSYSLGDEPASTELRCSVDGRPLPGFCPLELEDGEHTVAAFAKDLAGNRSVVAITFTVDVPGTDPDPTCETDPRPCPDPPSDSLAPTVGIAHLRQPVGSLKRVLKLKIDCSEACAGTIRATGSGGLAFRGEFTMNRTGSIEVGAKPTRRTRTGLLRRISPVRLKVRAIATDPSGNRSLTTRHIRVRR